MASDTANAGIVEENVKIGEISLLLTEPKKIFHSL